MNKIFLKMIIALLAILCGVSSSLQAQGVNTDRYITLTVISGADIKLNLMATASNTQVKIISGSTERIITANTSWTGFQNYLSDGSTMTVYGDVERLNCSGNGDNITAIDISHNIELSMLWCSDNRIKTLNIGNNAALVELYCEKNNIENLDLSRSTGLKVLDCSDNRLVSIDLSNNKSLTEFSCYKNALTTGKLDDIYCALPDYTNGNKGNIFPLYASDDTSAAAVLASNGNNATSKNWEILYYDEGTEITGFTGTRKCEENNSNVNMSRYITLNVVKDSKIMLKLAADADDTKIKIVSGSDEQTITVGAAWTDDKEYTAADGTMTIYGNVQKFNCNENGKNITGLDVSHNTQLNILFCAENSISALDLSKNTELEAVECYSNSIPSLDITNSTKLTRINCFGNSLTSLDLSKCTELEWLYCFDNSIASLDISKNTKLIFLNCSSNRLTSLDISKNTELEWLYCFNNSIATLDVSDKEYLKALYCYSNSFTTTALDNIYCSLPDRKDYEVGVIVPLFNASSPDKEKVIATNGRNAASRNWDVRYYESDSNIAGFKGTHQCGGSAGIDNIMTEADFAVYPNPVKDIINISSDKPVHSIRVYNVYGVEVLHATDVTNINVSHLPSGVYMVNVGGKVTRIIKQ